jgi:cathepsin X
MYTQILIISIITFNVFAAPTNFTWTNINDTTFVPTPKNQNFPKVCNSAWAFAAISVLNSRIKIQRKATWPDISLSPQVLLECDNSNFGCDGVFNLVKFRAIQKMHINGYS